MPFICNSCNKTYKSSQSLWNHNNKFHKKIQKKDTINDNIILNPEKKVKINNISNDNIIINSNEIKEDNCKFCAKKLANRHSRWRHEKKCINKKVIDNVTNIGSNQLINKNTINNQLINIIMEKTKTIEELNNKVLPYISINQNINNTTNEDYTKFLIFNNIIINSRTKDNYINAKQLCKAGNTKFKLWISLDTTNELIKELSNQLFKNTINYSLIDINNKEAWIHPTLAIHLAQWISSDLALKLNDWIINFFTIENIKLLKNYEKEIILKDMQIQLLQDQFQKKQQRKDYPEKNVIYILTTEDNKKKRIYIIGKAKKLKNRLSTYNKTAEHEVIYYKECKNEEDMTVIELMVLNKLKKYKEKANRDRFILPIENDISFFTAVIDKIIDFFN